MRINKHVDRLEERRTVRSSVTFEKSPTLSNVLKPLPRPDDAMEAFEAVQDRLNSLIFLMNSGELTPGDLDRLAKVFAGLRQYVREANRIETDLELGEEHGMTEGTKGSYPFTAKIKQYKLYTDDQLRFALDDAMEAAKAMSTHDQDAENWYKDDMATIRQEMQQRGILGSPMGMSHSRARRLRRKARGDHR